DCKRRTTCYTVPFVTTEEETPMYAIIEDSGTQIKVSEGDVIRIDLRDLPDGAGEVPSVTFDRVLLVGGEGVEAKVGTPVLDGAKVTADVLNEDVSDKVDIYKFKRRKNYRRHKGHRQHYIQVKITAINA
ncbi:MAG: 50S ribosomal protein L21, partial [Phycisphaeraceae bacterium]